MSLSILFAGFGVVGHLAVCAMTYNRLHALPLSKKIRDAFEKLLLLWAAAILLLVAWFAMAGRSLVTPPEWTFAQPSLTIYLAICSAAFIAVAVVWGWRKCTFRVPAMLVSNHTRTYDVAQQLGYRPVGKILHRMAAAIPGNQLFELDVNEKLFELPNLSPTLDGLSITHITDLHFTGGQTRAFYDVVLDQAQQFDSDLIAITGDIVDDSKLISWIPETLGRLTARAGVYYVLGNHDHRLPDVPALRRCLNEAGLIDLGASCKIIEVRETPILIGGNERVWFGPPPDPPKHEAEDGKRSLRVLLSHSPDQIAWARRHHFDLMLAGHTHGGQIRLPVLGPFVSPSRFGVKYASGIFYEEPTLMHVSRGISAEHPIRFNCRPELTKIVLKSASRSR